MKKQPRKLGVVVVKQLSGAQLAVVSGAAQVPPGRKELIGSAG